MEDGPFYRIYKVYNKTINPWYHVIEEYMTIKALYMLSIMIEDKIK